VESANRGESRYSLDEKSAGLQEGNRYGYLNAEPRRLVVCGITVISARSWSPKAPLTTRAGRVFPAMPKSISQTSPRRGLAVILSLKGLEQGGGGSADFLVFQGPGIER
jgi:hypothetical protein